MAQRQRADSAVRDDGNVAAAANRRGEHVTDRRHDASLGVEGALPRALRDGLAKNTSPGASNSARGRWPAAERSFLTRPGNLASCG
jgi:hypothetical protein